MENILNKVMEQIIDELDNKIYDIKDNFVLNYKHGAVLTRDNVDDIDKLIKLATLSQKLKNSNELFKELLFNTQDILEEIRSEK